MKHKRKGFTLVEIMLFLAITALLFVGIIVGTNNSIAQQRFTDSVQNFAELLRSIYSEVSNPQSVGEGRADVAIYGKLISFGQTVGLDGEKISDKLEQRIFIYDVVGNADEKSSGKVADVLSALGANVAVVTERDGDRIIQMGPAGEVREYTPRWGASIETTSEDVTLGGNGRPKNLFRGMILIVRHPRSGTINTLIYDENEGTLGTIEINKIINNANKSGNFEPVKNMLKNAWKKFKTKDIDFCINPRGAEKISSIRRDIRLAKNARNASSLQLIDLDLDEKREIDGVVEQIGNRCRFSS